jgi:two-component system alkaline phosphatase synthesis response regulator PhoP
LNPLSDRPQNAPKRILIADDAASARDLVCSILGRSGYEIFEAEDGEEALESATRLQPDLVILDLQMPKLDGCGVASRLRSMPSFQDTPIMALSAGISHMEPTELRRCGFSAALAKPISPAKLRSTIIDMFDVLDTQGKS